MKTLLMMAMQKEEGQGMVEYAIIIAGIALAVIATIWLMGPVINNIFNDLLNQL